MSATVTTSAAHDGSSAANKRETSALNGGEPNQKALEKRQRKRGLNDFVTLDDSVVCSACTHYTDAMSETRRDRVLNVRLTEAEVGMLTELADHDAISQSDWIRTIIKVEHARTFRPKASKPAKRKY